MAFKYQWDEKKAAENLAQHDVSFEMACEVFKDPLALQEPDHSESYSEERFTILGMVSDRLLFVAFTERSEEGSRDEIIRIISARKATRPERRRYHEA